MVSCLECGTERKMLSQHLKSVHSWTTAQYRERYPGAPVQADFYKQILDNGRTKLIAHQKSENGRRAASAHVKKLHADPETHAKMVAGWCTSEAAKKSAATKVEKYGYVPGQFTSERVKQFWRDNPEVMKAANEKARHAAINVVGMSNVEKYFERLCQEYELPYVFVGDYKMSVAGKPPDFLCTEFPALVEIYGTWIHKPEEVQARIDFFQNYGWPCKVYWDYEVTNDTERVIEEIRSWCPQAAVSTFHIEDYTLLEKVLYLQEVTKWP